MTDEVKLALQIGLNLIAILLAGWLAGHYAARQVQKVLESERQRARETRQRALVEVVANLPPVPPEWGQMAEIERWVLAARSLQLLLASLCTLIRIRLRADRAAQHGVWNEIDRSLKLLGRQENQWLSKSLPVVGYARQLDPARGRTRDQALETCMTRLNQSYVQAAQSSRRAASLCDSDGPDAYSDTMANAYLTEAERATSDLAGVIASALDRVTYLRQHLPERQVEQIAALVAESAQDADGIFQADGPQEGVVDAADPTVNMVASSGRAT